MADGAKTPRVQGGESTSDLILSAHVGENPELFAEIMALHVPIGSAVADVTYGKGVFWKAIQPGTYDVWASDIGTVPRPTAHRHGVDCRELPYGDDSFDCVVLDPPYIEGFYRRSSTHLAGSGTHSSFRRAYSAGTSTHDPDDGGPKYHDAVIDLYFLVFELPRGKAKRVSSVRRAAP